VKERKRRWGFREIWWKKIERFIKDLKKEEEI